MAINISLRDVTRIVLAFLLLSALLPLLIVHSRTFSTSITYFGPGMLSEWKQNPLSDGTVIEEPSKSEIKGKWSEWNDGCHVPSFQQPIEKESPPIGLVVVLALAAEEPTTRVDTLQRICHVVPGQFEYFLSPQGLDMLFVVQEDYQGWNVAAFVACWNLRSLNTTKTWYNLDGTELTTMEYQYMTKDGNTVKVFLASTILEYPYYIQQNPSILTKPLIPRSCQAPRGYIQATRWYTKGLLNLAILKEYDYFLKIDTDVVFVESVPFYLLQDMAMKNAVFGHTAEYHPRGSKTCAMGINAAMVNFTETHTHRKYVQTDLPPWNGTLCSIEPEVQRDADQYYTNFIVGRVEFWQSPWILEWSNFLNEYPEGFFKYRWTDQIFWHYAMGLFLRNFKEYVVDFTTLRCMPNPDCWQSSYNFQRYGQSAWHNCENGGYFLHPKDYHVSLSKHPTFPIPHGKNLSQSLYPSTYQGDCSKK
jgi:hypothetical protein